MFFCAQCRSACARDGPALRKDRSSVLQLAGGAAGGLGSSDANAAAMLNPAAIASPGAARADWPIASRQSGRIEARIGLRMMPTFPRSSLSFRTAGFPQYGWKAGCPSGAFLGDRRLKPAPDIRRPPSSLHPPFVHFVVATVVRSESGLRTRSCTAMRWNTPPTPGALARVRVVLSRSVIT